MKKRAPLMHFQLLLDGGKFEKVQAFERPPMGPGDQIQFVLGFRERDVKNSLLLLYSFEQELKAERRLSNSRVTFHEIEAIAGEAPTQNIIETLVAAAAHWCRG